MVKRDMAIAGPEPVSPGDVLQTEFVAKRGITQDRLAEALGVSRYSVNQLLNDRRNVTAEMALRLSRVLGTSPEFWLNLQRDVDLYRVSRRKGQEINALSPLSGGEFEAPLASLDSLFGHSS